MKEQTNKYVILHNQRRKQILETSKRLILTRTIASVSMSDIASACGISRQTLYKYFGNFDEIIYGIQKDIMEQFPLPEEMEIHTYLHTLADMLFQYSQEESDNFLFICMFDIYARSHTSDSFNHQMYRSVIQKKLPDYKKMLPDSSQNNRSYASHDVFVVAVHMIWAYISRMAVLGDAYFETGHLTAEKSLDILKDMIDEYLEKYR